MAVQRPNGIMNIKEPVLRQNNLILVRTMNANKIHQIMNLLSQPITISTTLKFQA
jgi:hypothetical protein